jgi:hypothetical protein
VSLPSSERIVPLAAAVFIPTRELLRPPFPWTVWTRDAMVAFLRQRRIDAEDVVNWIRCRIVASPEIAGLDTWRPPYAPEDGLWVYYRGEPQRGDMILRRQ